MTRSPRHIRWSRSIVLAVVLLTGQVAASVAQTAPAAQPTPSPQAPAQSDFTPAQTLLILALAPLKGKSDRSNRVTGKPDAIAFGRSLFFDARLSGKGTHSCSSCHRPELAWQDGKRVGEGLALSKRNTPSLLNVRYRRWFGWDGAADSLWAQSIRPILDPREMGASAGHVRAHIAGNTALADAYAELFKRAATTTLAEDILVDAAKALAAYQETLVSPSTPFDDFRDALERGDSEAAKRYPISARQGLLVFLGVGGCHRCHFGPLLQSDGFERLTATARRSRDNPDLGRPDLGRYDGVARLLASPYNQTSRYNDSGSRVPIWTVSGDALRRLDGDKYRFRVPGLRGVKDTAPYMHDGSVATLAEAVAHRVPAAQFWKSDRRKLTAAEIVDLVAFLETLSLP
jgi:cytochrome c peroxidase